MEEFAKQSLRIGCIKGFKHVSFYLRGSEELVVKVRTPRAAGGGGSSPFGGAARGEASVQDLPPASPFSRETQECAADETIFLIGAYAKYGRPFVWLRSSNSPASMPSEKDLPLTLDSTEASTKTDFCPVWEIIAELVMKCCPDLANPFEIDFPALQGQLALSGLERALNYAAVAGLLTDIYLDGGPFFEIVSADMHMATEKHIKAVPALVSAASQSQSGGSLFGGQTPALATPEKRKISFATQ